MTFDALTQDRLRTRLRQIYGPQADQWLPQLLGLMQRYADLRRQVGPAMWDQRDVVLITYGDQIKQRGRRPLEALRHFLADYGLSSLINTVHLLPFNPHTSDDGFSVVDYRAVDPALGGWQDIHALGQQVDLMFDLVLNHVSQASAWFQGYLAGDRRYADYFIETDPAIDLSAVTRPRSLPLLTQFGTRKGMRHVWTTFSADQVDLDYSNPAVLLDVLDVLLYYIQQGARFVRLDAIAYLWKEVGTNCIHLRQTHAIVKLMRDVVNVLAPHVVLLTETNVPHAENVSYFGDGDEAHMVYQFSLPPLLADALLQHDATVLNRWLSSLDAAREGTTFFNFTASHDGVGVRPLEGLLSAARRQQLVEAARMRGGLVSMRRNPDGSDAPYELNISYLDLLADPDCPDPQRHADRFLASQAMMLALRGIPGIYFHSLVGTRNDTEAAAASGIARRINRHKFEREQLDSVLTDEMSLQHKLLHAYRHLLAVRVAQPAFHPDGGQALCQFSSPVLLAWLRTAPDATQRILVVANLSGQMQTVDLSPHGDLHLTHDLLTEREIPDSEFELRPYQVAWLVSRGARG